MNVQQKRTALIAIELKDCSANLKGISDQALECSASTDDQDIAFEAIAVAKYLAQMTSRLLNIAMFNEEEIEALARTVSL